MSWCRECLVVGSHDELCTLRPGYVRPVSRRSFLRTIGVLGTAIAVAPQLLELPSAGRATMVVRSHTTLGMPLAKVWRRIQGELMMRQSFDYGESWAFDTSSIPEGVAIDSVTLHLPPPVVFPLDRTREPFRLL